MTDLAVAPPLDVHGLRAAEFPHLGPSPYLNAASVTPTPERTRRAMAAYDERRCRVHELCDDDFEPTLRRARHAAARLVGADADEIALLPNTTAGIHLAARALPVPAGSRIVVSAGEFPANVYPWMQRARDADARLEVVPLDAHGQPDEERIRGVLDAGNVSVFAVSAVQFATGWHADLVGLGRFCRARGIRFVVDGIQALGQIPIDVRAAEIDVLATGGHKWLCGPFGTGFAYARRELVAALEPPVAGWTVMSASADYARVTDYRWDYVDDARRFEGATMPFQDVAGLTASLELLLEVGVERIREHISRLVDPLARFVTDHPSLELASDMRTERRSGIVSIRPRDPGAVLNALHAAGVGCVLREGGIRLAPHLYNTADEVATVMEVMERVGGR